MKTPTNIHANDRFSITPSGFFGSSKSNIVELENFMTDEELTKISNFAAYRDWEKIGRASCRERV